MQFLLKSQLILSFRVPFRNQMSRKYKRHSSTFFIMSVMKLKFKILKTAPQKSSYLRHLFAFIFLLAPPYQRQFTIGTVLFQCAVFQVVSSDGIELSTLSVFRHCGLDCRMPTTWRHCSRSCAEVVILRWCPTPRAKPWVISVQSIELSLQWHSAFTSLFKQKKKLETCTVLNSK